MTEKTDYINLMDEIIVKLVVILGPDIVLLKAKNVAGLKVNNAGKVEKIDGDPQQVLQDLVNEYTALSGQVVNNILAPVFAKYPQIKLVS